MIDNCYKFNNVGDNILCGPTKLSWKSQFNTSFQLFFNWIKLLHLQRFTILSGGDVGPLFCFIAENNAMSLKNTLEEIVAKHLPDDNHFVVDIIVAGIGNKSQVRILIDSDKGVSIDACAKVSRAVGDEIEAKELITEAFVLEVSSPGLDHPLTSRRQYLKNIERKLKVSMSDGKDIEGILSEVGNTDIKLLTKVKEKGKKAQELMLTIPFEQIKKSIVLVSFK